MSRRPHISKARIGLVVLVLLLGCLAHSAMLPASFKTLDDESSIINNADIRDVRNTGRILTTSFFGSGHYYRPLVTLSYMLEYHLFGLRPFYYNLDNLFLHLTIAVTVFFIVRAVLLDTSAAFFASLLFAVHPVQWEAVANISGRAVILSTLFCVNALFFFIQALDRSQAFATRTASAPVLITGIGGKDAGGYYALSLVLFACGLLSKESAAMLPVLLLAYLGLARGELRRWRWVLPYFGLILVYIFMRHTLGITNTYPWRSPTELALGVATFLRAVLTFLRMFIVPAGLHFDRAQALFTSFADPRLWATVVTLAAGTVLAVRAGRRLGLGRASLFFLAWFVIELVPVSQIVTTIGVAPGYISAAEHFLYMPAAGMFAVLAIGGQALYRAAARKHICSPWVLNLALACIVLSLMVTTFRRGLDAQDALQMYHRTLSFNPFNSRILYSLGMEMAQRGRYAEAEHYFRRTMGVDPLHTSARHALGRALRDQGQFAAALAEYQAVLEAGHKDELLERNLREVYPLAIEQYRAWLAADAGNSQIHYSLGTVYSRAGRIEEGVDAYLKAVALKPDHREALFNLASSYDGLGQLQLAAAFYERLIALNAPVGPLEVQALHRLSEIHGPNGPLPDAVKAAYFEDKLKAPSALKP